MTTVEISRGETALRAQPTPPAGAAETHKPLRILIVEDMPTDAVLIERSLRQAGMDLVTRRVAAWPDLIEALKTFSPDLVLSDYRLPGFDGLKALIYIRKNHPELPVVIVSGALGEATVKDLVKFGALDCVSKDELVRLAPAVKRALSAAKASLKILILEDEPLDAEMTQRALHKGGLSFKALRVDRRETFADALNIFEPDIVLIDCALPAYDGREALADLRRTHPEIPAIIVSGYLGDEAAIELLHGGAKDYVLKSNLVRLPSAVERAMSMEAGIRARKAAERAVRESETKYRTIVETTVDVIWELDAAGNFAYLSPQIGSLLGCEPAELLNAPVLDIIAEEDQTRIRRFMDSIIVEGKPFTTVEAWCRRRDGGKVAVEVSGTSVRDENGKLVGFRGITHDITERKRADAKLIEEEAKFRTIVEQNIAGIAIIWSDLKVGYMNPYLVGLLGYAGGELNGSDFLQVVADPHKQGVADHIRAHTSGDRSPVKAEIALRARDGRVIDIFVNAAPTTYAGKPASLGVLLDITEAKKTERALQRTNRALRTLGTGNEIVSHAQSEQELLEQMCRVIVDTGGYRMAWIGFAGDDAAKPVRPRASAGHAGAYVETAEITWADEPRGRGPTGRAIREGRPQSVRDLANDPAMAPWRAEGLKCGFASSAAFPLRDASGVFGSLSIYAAEKDAFGADEMRLLGNLAEDLSFGVRSLRERQHIHELDRRWHGSLEATIGAVANTIEMRDRYTAGHQQRVARLAAAIARELKLSEEDIHGIYLAGTVHDIGKIMVPAEFLSKPGKISDIEFSLIQAHVEAGYNILKDVDFPWPIARTMREHHERLDGSGYPRGLKDGEISREGLILAVADVVEAMSSSRPYRQSLGIDAALAEIEQNKGRLYDPSAVDACVRLFRERGFRFEQPLEAEVST